MSAPNLLRDVSESDIERCLSGPGLGLSVASFRCLLWSDTKRLAAPVKMLYQDHVTDLEPHGFYDFRIRLKRSRSSLWGWQNVEFDWEGSSPFPAMKVEHAHPLFEWGLNWCVATAHGQNIVIHSAVVEKHGLALVLPGDPGSGKSTLCAALVMSGWRLLSDELTIVSRADGKVQPVPRPISLKNKSIDIIRNRFPHAELTDPVTDTHKGAIAYARAPTSSVLAADEPVPIGFVVFPKYRAGTELGYEPLSRAAALTELLSNTFNVGLLGRAGFESLAHAMTDAQCHAVEYGDLDSILAWIEAECQTRT